MDSDSDYSLKLFVAGHSERSEAAIANLRRICDSELAGHHRLVVIDILEQPDAADGARILATPTLVKESPLPMRRIIGDLSDRDKVIAGLGLRP